MKASKMPSHRRLLALMAIGLIIGGAGLYAYKNSQKNKPESAGINSSQNETQGINQENKPQVSYEGWSDYTIPLSSLQIKYPADWKPSIPSDQASEYSSISFEAPNTKVEQAPIGADYIVSGAKIFVYSSRISEDSPVKSIEEFNKSDQFTNKHARNKSERNVNGIKMLNYDLGYEGPNTYHTLFYADSVQYIITIQKDVYEKPGYKAVYDNLINSIGRQ